MTATKRRVLITVDVEASPDRQSSHHVDRLIWGRFDDQEVGIGRMMELAERYGHRLTFFVDFCERFLYPGALEEVVASILWRGHDVQPHAHPSFLPDDFWRKRGFEQWKTSLSGYTRERAQVLMEFLADTMRELGIPSITAFRGGGFRYNHEVLRALAEFSIPLSSNYNVKSDSQPNSSENLSAFRWDNGVIELPIGHLFFQKYLRTFELNLMDFRDRGLINGYIDEYFRVFGEEAVLVMLMHSWSFCEKDPSTGHFEYRDPKLIQAFDRFLRELPAEVDVMTAVELGDEIRSGRFMPTKVRSIDLTDRERYPAPELTGSPKARVFQQSVSQPSVSNPQRVHGVVTPPDS